MYYQQDQDLVVGHKVNADRRNLTQLNSNNWWMAHERALFFMLKSRFLVNLVVSDSPQRPYQI